MEVRPKVGVACFVWRDGKFLVQQRIGSHGEGTWSLPGGHLEMDESWADCASRETMEETGMETTNVRYLATTNDMFKEAGKHFVTIWMEADWQANEPAIMEPDRLRALAWVTFQSLPEPLFEPCWHNLRHAKPELFG